MKLTEIYTRMLKNEPNIHDKILMNLLEEVEVLLSKHSDKEFAKKITEESLDLDFTEKYNFRQIVAEDHKLAKILFVTDLIKSICYSQRIIYRLNFEDWMINEWEAARGSYAFNHAGYSIKDDYVEDITNMINSTDIPFEDTSICVQDGEKEYLVSFFENTDKRIDKDGNEETLYTCKIIELSNDMRLNFIGFKQNYRIITEFSLLKSMFPRLITFVNVNADCMYCHQNTSNFNFISMDKIMGTDNVYPDDTSIAHCLKSPRMASSCVNSTFDAFKELQAPKIFEAYAALKLVFGLFSKINKSVEAKKMSKLRKVSREDEINNFKSIFNGRTEPEDKFGFIEIHSKKNRISCSTHSRSSKHGSHSSPCEHPRVAHYRTLKSGKVIPVKSSIVNEGKKKPIIVIKD